MQQMALYMFNDYREQLAEGRITHPHQREKGARVMFLLTWSQTLAEEAAKAIESCHEPSSTIFKQPLAKEEDAAMFIESAIEHWKKRLRDFQWIGHRNRLCSQMVFKGKHQLAHCKFRSVQTLLMAYLKQHYLIQKVQHAPYPKTTSVHKPTPTLQMAPPSTITPQWSL
uniref:Uncharacterized protein n=1 Tax=Ditylenchus dipsaci TaxID=166011 RepID=A0A915ECF3_9BILA